MIEKPQPKKEVAIDEVFTGQRMILLYSTPDAIADFKSFGSVLPFISDPNRYQITVDKRYDFDEVVRYIQEY